ncbi:hypothetical protein D1970_02045 [Mesobacillus zeae]|uniref:Uncharacterized protein n=1 Tax=Mesobacillus zeae TaxID=1917180 RepID=A0A398BE99_9BACI|nr:hypothetical protein D1970_02045 [Mesobacillus zeae]
MHMKKPFSTVEGGFFVFYCLLNSEVTWFFVNILTFARVNTITANGLITQSSKDIDQLDAEIKQLSDHIDHPGT